MGRARGHTGHFPGESQVDLTGYGTGDDLYRRVGGTRRCHVSVIKASAVHPLYRRLCDILDESRVTDNPLVTTAYSRDASHLTAERPGVVVMPEDVEEVQAIVRLCAETKTALVPAGGRNGICGACLPRTTGAVVVDMSRMDRLVQLDEEVMTVTAEAGMRWAELIHRLDERGYKLGFRGPYGGNVGTVGGSVSINSIGYAASKFGPSTEGVVSLEVVLASGEVLRTGTGWNPAAKLFGRYSAFPDLTGVFLGDHGTLGIKTKVTLKVYPKAEHIAYGDFGFRTLQDAVAAFREIQAHGLTEELNLLADRESTDTFFPGFLDSHREVNAMFAAIVQETDEALARRKMGLVRETALRHGGKDLGSFASQMHWRELFNLVQPLYNNGFWLNTCHLRPITAIPALMERAWRIFKKHKLKKHGIKWIASCLGSERTYATGWVTLFIPSRDKTELALRAWDELLDAVMETGGCPYWNGLLWESRALARADPVFMGVLRGIKQVLDPDNIFCPHVFGGDE